MENNIKNIDSNSFENILVIRDGRLGDVLMISPVINWLSGKFPKAQLDVIVGQYGSFIFEENPIINNLILYNKNASIIEQIKFIKKLRNRYDLIVILEANSHYKILAYLISAKVRIGISGKLNCLLDYHYSWDKSTHAILNNLNVLRPLFSENDSPSNAMSLYLSDRYIEKAYTFLKDNNVNTNKLLVFVHPACGANDVLRPWPKKHIATLADLLIEKLNAKVILHAGPNEKIIVKEIQTLMRYNPIINNKCIGTTAALIKFANIFVGPDTGTLHIANALKTPIIALFGPSSTEDCGPIGPKERIIVLKKEFICSPCMKLKESKNKDKCIKQKMADCMNAISVEEVFSNIEKLLNNKQIL